ncbi:MAG: hypothetical protein ACYC6M_16520 [Terriglobales bacterium]
MKIGYYCESPVDRAAMAVFTEGLLGAPPEPISMDLEGRSVPAFFSALGGVFRGVHFNSDAEGLIVVVDCDDTELHVPAHDAIPGGGEGCRLCQARKIIAQARKQLKPRQGRPELKVAIGLAVPAIEAWYLVGKNHQVGEAAWNTGLAAGRPPFTRPQLKKLVYGLDRPSLEHMTECAVREARRIILNIEAIETAFPAGFGLMAHEIRSWTAR